MEKDIKLRKTMLPVLRPYGGIEEVEALRVGVENGFLSHQDVQASYGRDVEDVFSQIQSDKELADKFGIQLAFEPFGQKQIQQNEPNEVEEEAEK